MSSHLVFNGVGDAVKGESVLLGQEAAEAGRAPRPVPRGVREIRLTISHHEHNPRHELYKARGVVNLPTGTLAAEATDDDPQVVVNRIVDTLVAEVRRHKEKVRKDYVYKRKDRNRADLSAAGPQLQQHTEAGNREDFFRMPAPISASCATTPAARSACWSRRDPPPWRADGQRPARAGRDPGLRAIQGPPAEGVAGPLAHRPGG